MIIQYNNSIEPSKLQTKKQNKQLGQILAKHTTPLNPGKAGKSSF